MTVAQAPALISLIALFSIVAEAPASATPSIVEYEAEDQSTSGVVIGPDRSLGTLAAEASGRRAVRLERVGQSIDIRLTAPANALTIRYSIAAAQDGQRRPATALIEAGGRPPLIVPLTSRYSIGNIATPTAADPHKPVHHYWEEIRVRLPQPIETGTNLSIRIAPGAAANPFAIDVIDAETLPTPVQAPARSISVLQFGADPSGRRGSRGAFIRAVAAAQRIGRVLYVPVGRYRVDGHILVNRVTIVGAGSWYSVLRGHRVGFHSLERGSSRVSLSGFAIESDVWRRVDRARDEAIGGKFDESRFTDLYLHHAKVGIWIDGPAHNLTISDNEIADAAADGINLHRGVSNARVEDNRIRNVADDGIASWSDGVANQAIVISRNRISLPGLANAIAVYGGRNIEISDNDIADVVVEGGGIHLGARFHSAPFSGSINIRNNRIVRAGTQDPNWHFGVGAIWIYALERPIEADISLVDNVVVEPGCEAVQLIGPNRIDGVTVDGLRVIAAATSPLALQTHGAMSAERVVVETALPPLAVEVPADFQLTSGGGNRGWSVVPVPHPHPPECR